MRLDNQLNTSLFRRQQRKLFRQCVWLRLFLSLSLPYTVCVLAMLVGKLLGLKPVRKIRLVLFRMRSRFLFFFVFN